MKAIKIDKRELRSRTKRTSTDSNSNSNSEANTSVNLDRARSRSKTPVSPIKVKKPKATVSNLTPVVQQLAITRAASPILQDPFADFIGLNMANADSFNGAANALNNLTAEFNINVAGMTPAQIVAQLEEHPLTADIRNEFISYCLIAATVKRQRADEFLSGKPALRNYINSFWSIQNKPNYSGITLIGHMLLRAFAFAGFALAANIRIKLAGQDIWTKDLNAPDIKISSTQIAIFKQKKERFPAIEVDRIIAAFRAAIINDAV